MAMALRPLSPIRCSMPFVRTSAPRNLARQIHLASSTRAPSIRSDVHPWLHRSPQLFHTTSNNRIDILDTSDSPAAASPTAESTSTSTRPTAPTPLTESSYHEISTHFFDSLVQKLEDKAEDTDGLEVEYSAGVLNVTLPPPESHTFVLNKQPPNKQIWLSSPVSGPKRFDWCLIGEKGMDAKEGTERGEWIYLRDGTSLGALLKDELGVDVEGVDGEDIT